MKVWRNLAMFLIFFLLITNSSHQTRVMLEKRAVVKDNLAQALPTNSTKFRYSSHPGEERKEGKVLPEVLMQKTNDLLSDAVHMLNNIQDKSARRWLENFIFKIGDLASEMETTKAPYSLSELPYMPPSSTPITSTNSNHHGTAAELGNVIPVDDTINEQVATKPGIPFFETDELVNQLHDQSNIERQQISNRKRLLSELSHRSMPSVTKDVSGNQVLKEGLQSGGSSEKQNINKQNLQIVQEESSDQGNVNVFEESNVEHKENFGSLGHAETAQKRTFATTSFASQISEPLGNTHDSYSKEKALLLKNGFRKKHALAPTREEWLLSHIYQQHTPYHRTIQRPQSRYKNIPLKRYLSFGYTMIPLPQRKRIIVRPQQLRYTHYNEGGNPRFLKSTYLRYPKLQEAFLLNNDNALPHQKNSSYGKLLTSNKTAIKNRTNTFPDLNQFDQIKKLSTKRVSPISKTTKRLQSHLRRSNMPNFSKRYLTSEYLPYYGRLFPQMPKKQSHVNSSPIGNVVGRSKIVHVVPTLTDIELQLRAGKVVILSDSLVRTNFEKHPKKSGKIAANSD